jgi:predicted nucleic acid-binding protein
MNVYVETNFVLELAFLQQQHESCEQVIALCENRRAALVLPTFSIAECYEALIRRATKRTKIKDDLDKELAEIGRSKPYKDDFEALQKITGLIVRSNEEEDRRLPKVLNRILDVADVIPLDAGVISEAASYRDRLNPQDSIVYSSVLRHLTSTGGSESCFINRNRKDFDDPDIRESLERRGCKMLFDFEKGYGYIEHRVNAAAGG